MTNHIPPSEIPLPQHLRDVMSPGQEVRMGAYLVRVTLADGSIVAPVVLGGQKALIGLATTTALYPLLPLNFSTDDVVAIEDASAWDDWPDV